MSRWIPVLEGEKSSLYVVEAAVEEEPVATYAELYRKSAEDLGEDVQIRKDDIQRHIDEILCGLESGCTLLLFGSGHPIYANTYHEKCSNIENIQAMDLVSEAGLGLNPEIGFICADIVTPIQSKPFSLKAETSSPSPAPTQMPFTCVSGVKN